MAMLERKQEFIELASMYGYQELDNSPCMPVRRRIVRDGGEANMFLNSLEHAEREECVSLLMLHELDLASRVFIEIRA